MRHIHVELARKEPTVQLPAQEGDLPPPTSTPADGHDLGVARPGGVPRPFGDQEIRMQKVYQLSIFSQRGGYLGEVPGESQQRGTRVGLKRGLEDPVTPIAQKRLHEAGQEEAREEVAGKEEEEQQEEDGEDMQGEVLCGSTSVDSYYVRSPGAASPTAATLTTAAKTSPPRSPPSQSLSPTHTYAPPYPSRRPAQHNHDRPVPDPWAPLSPKSPPMVDPHGSPHGYRSSDPSGSSSPVLSPEPPPAGDAPACSIGSPPHSNGSSNGSSNGYSNGSNNGYSNGSSSNGNGTLMASVAEQGASSWLVSSRSPSPPYPHSPPSSSSSPRRFLEALEWSTGLESSPPPRTADHRGASSPTTSSTHGGVPSTEKTPVDPRAFLNGTYSSNPSAPCPAKKKLLSSSDTADSCSEDEGPSTSKRSRLALLAPGLGLASCRSTDAKAAPFWNHLLPSARQHHKVRTIYYAIYGVLYCIWYDMSLNTVVYMVCMVYYIQYITHPQHANATR